MKSALSARTWYQDTGIAPPTTFEKGSIGSKPYDVAIIGGGLAGLVTLLQLAGAGVNAILIEVGEIASGASGRNGGFCSGGWAAGGPQIARLVGHDAAAELDVLADQGLRWMRTRMSRLEYASTQPVDGELLLSLWSEAPSIGPNERLLSNVELRDTLSSSRYKYGLYSSNGLHFHPLNFMRLLARDAIYSGGTILEQTQVNSIVKTYGGYSLGCASLANEIKAGRIVIATGGYGRCKSGFSTRHLLPIQTYIGVTSPLSDVLDSHIKTNWAISDRRRAGNYYRRLPDGRLLWGMAITAFGSMNPDAISHMILHDIRSVYPKLVHDMLLDGAGIDYAWAGNMAYARHSMPYVGEIDQGYFVVSGFGGHGMNTAPAAAMALSRAMLGDKGALDPFDAIPRRPVFGKIGAYAAEYSYRQMQLCDWLKEWGNNF